MIPFWNWKRWAARSEILTMNTRCQGSDDKTKFMISPRVNAPITNVVRVWGTTFKPALKKECERLGVKIFDRVMATSLLTEKGIQGARVVGATGVNTRTGEFMIFKAKATILCTAGAAVHLAHQYRIGRLFP